jgi:hypothetical protein
VCGRLYVFRVTFDFAFALYLYGWLIYNYFSYISKAHFRTAHFKLTFVFDFDIDLNQNNTRFYELITCLAIRSVRRKLFTTFIAIDRTSQFPPSRLHFSHCPDDWSSRSRYRAHWLRPVNSIYLPGTITFSHLAVKKWSLAWATREQWRQLPRHIVRQFQSPYTPSPRGLSRISARQVALALASRFSRMLSFQIKDMEFTGCD